MGQSKCTFQKFTGSLLPPRCPDMIMYGSLLEEVGKGGKVEELSFEKGLMTVEDGHQINPFCPIVDRRAIK